MSIKTDAILFKVSVIILIGLFSGCHLLKRSGKDPLALEFVRIEGGRYLMGDFLEKENEDALPVHPVEVKTFHLSKYEVTYDQYDAFARATNRPLPDDDGAGRGKRAVAFVSWDDAIAFCEYYGYRLPTEAEWEYAARGGGQQMVYAGTNHAAELGKFAFYKQNGLGFSMPVGMKAPNVLGIFDLTGNVSEWVSDYYEKYPLEGQKPIYKDLTKPGMRLARGGSFHHDEAIVRTYWRAGTLNDIGSFSIGFRCAK